MTNKWNKEKVDLSSNRILLSVAELAGILSIRPQTIYNKMSQGLFPIKHKKIGKLVRFDRRELDKFLDSLPDYR